MKSFLKSLLKKILFKTEEAKSFPAVRINDGEIIEKVFLKKGNATIEISERHCIVCHSPFYMATWLTSEDLPRFNADNLQAEILTGNQVSANLILSYNQSIEIGGKWLAVFKVNNATCFQIDPFRQFLIRRYFKNKNTMLQDRMYGAMYSYPRKVIAVSYKDKEYYNIFPMDFQCFNKETNIYVLGLRTTNITLEKIVQTKKLVISDTTAANIADIYFLGSHHGTAPPSVDKLPFEIADSEVLKFPVPDFAASYKEIEIIENRELGSHMLLIGKVINAKVVGNPTSSLYHIHFLQSLKSDYKG